MRIPYGFTLTNSGGLETNKSEAENVALIFNFYMAGASLGKVVDMLYAKQIPSPTEKAARCNIDYDKEGLPRKSTRYVSHIMAQK